MEGAASSGVLVAATGTIFRVGEAPALQQTGTMMRAAASPAHTSSGAGAQERQALAAAFARLAPLRVLWRLTRAEVPDDAALEALHLGNNTKVPKLALYPGRCCNSTQCFMPA